MRTDGSRAIGSCWTAGCYGNKGMLKLKTTDNEREITIELLVPHFRALYDIHLAKQVEPKIYIRCCLCGENISSKEEHKRKMRNATEKGANSGMLCQACQKPSLKCSVCSFYMAIDPPRSGFYGNKGI